MMIDQGELFPEMVVLEPTISMERGDTYVAQCSWCGLLVCADRKYPLGECPACRDHRPAGYRHSWWEQESVNTGPFRELICATCEKPVDPEYSVVFTWWDEERVHHPSCIQTFEVGAPVPAWAEKQGGLARPEGVQEARA